MRAASSFPSGRDVLVAGIAAAAGVYAACAAAAWSRYGRVPRPAQAERDDLLDVFMPEYEIVERHHIRIAAPADVVMAAARDQDLFRLPFVNAIFKLREVVMRATPDERPHPPGLMAAAQALGWGVLADLADRELVMGAVTEPWQPNPTFRALSPERFAAFADPGFVKIVWTLRADVVGDAHTVFRTETRAVATDATARARFRRYWAFASPGIGLIRWLSLRPLKRDAERSARAADCLCP
jgi:hypothetical protein